MPQSTPLFLDDLVVGAEYRSATHHLDQAQTIGFARQFDPQPFHIDTEAAKSSLFEGLAASGWHTAAITMKLLVGSLPLSGGIVGLRGELQWPRPVRPGDSLCVVSKIQKIVPWPSRPDRGVVTIACRTLNQRNEVCQRLVAKLVVARRPR